MQNEFEKIEWQPFSKVLLDRALQLEDQLTRRMLGEDVHTFIPTGLAAWDKNGGITRGVLTVLGGVDGQGKSVVKLHLAASAAKAGFRVCIIDFEDPKERTADREFSVLTGIDNRKLGLLDFSVEELSKVHTATKHAESWAARISYHGGLCNAESIMAALESLPEPPELVLLDYAQALPENAGSTLERTIAEMAWVTNKFAQKVNCGFVVFSQVKPEVNGRGHAQFHAARRRDPDSWDVSGFCPGPGTQDLAWSSAFGQRARAVGYLFRPGYYERSLGMPGAVDNRLMIRWTKVTFGATGMTSFGFSGPQAKIFDVEDNNGAS